MNKGQLIEAAAKKAALTQKQINAALDAVIDCITEAVAEGDKVTLVGFGSWEARERKEREGRNPKTGKKIDIPATVVPAFSAGKQFKDAVGGRQ